MKLKDKALRIIEALVSDDLSERITIEIAMDRPLQLSPDDTKVLANKIGTIYKVSHSTREDAICYEVHADWRGEINKLYRRYKRANLV